MWELLLTAEGLKAIGVLITALVTGFISVAKYVDSRGQKRADMQTQQFLDIATTVRKVDEQVSNTHSTNLREDLDLHKESLERIENLVTELHSEVTRESAARVRGDKAIREELDQIYEVIERPKLRFPRLGQ